MDGASRGAARLGAGRRGGAGRVTWISSSGVIAKVLGGLGRLGNRETPVILSILVLEDLSMAVYLPIITALLAGTGLAAGSLTLVAGLAQQLQVSAAVGAFLVGIALSGEAAEGAHNLLSPLRDLFAAVFFVFFGLHTDPASIPPVLLPALALAIVTAGTKIATGYWASRRAGISAKGRWRAGGTLVARGEFSIVIAGLAVTADIEPSLGPLATAYVLILVIVGPLTARYTEPLATGLTGQRRKPATAADTGATPESLAEEPHEVA